MICILPLRNIWMCLDSQPFIFKISRNSSEPSRSEAEFSTESYSFYFEFVLEIFLFSHLLSLSPRVCVCVCVHTYTWGFPGGASAGDVRDTGSIPGLGRSSEEGMATHSTILSWRIPMNIGAWWAMFYRVTKRWTQLKELAV